MGSGAGADKRGRYEEKGGGVWVGSLFEEDSDNERIKAIYGNYGLWAWLRYWYLDTENQIAMMLLDKGYHDYDYTEPKPKPRPLTEEDKKLMGSDELAALFATAIVKKGKKASGVRPQASDEDRMSDAERIQRDILNDKKLRAESQNNG